MSIADLESLNTAYFAAVDSSNWSTALGVLSKIAVRLATTPNLSRNLGSGGSQSITWTAQGIADQQKYCRQMLTAAAHATSGPFVTVPVKYARPDSSGDYV
jgi:hypothetical protein